MKKSDFHVGMRVLDTQGRTGKVVNIRESSVLYNLDSGSMESAPFKDLQPQGKKLSEIRSTINNQSDRAEHMRPETQALLEGKSKQYGIPLQELNRAWTKGMSTWNGQTMNPHQWAMKMVNNMCEATRQEWARYNKPDVVPNLSKLDVPTRHQTKIAHDTLKMSDAGARIMGGMSKEEARTHLKKIGYHDSYIKKLEGLDEDSHGGGGNQTSGNAPGAATGGYTDPLGYKNSANPTGSIGESLDDVFESLLVGTDDSARTMRKMTPGEEGYDSNAHLRHDPNYNPEFGHTAHQFVQSPVGKSPVALDPEARSPRTTGTGTRRIAEKRRVREDNDNLGPQVDIRSPAGASASPGGGIGPGPADMRENVLPPDAGIRAWATRPDIQNSFNERYGSNGAKKLIEAAHRMYSTLKEDGTPKKKLKDIKPASKWNAKDDTKARNMKAALNKTKRVKEDAIGNAGSGSTAGTTRPPFG
jgi:hypothetical protein